MSDWQFQWDEENIRHLARHKITPREAEQVFERIHAGRPTEPVDGEARFQAIGTTVKGRHLTIAYAERGAYTRPITGWPMEPEELELYVEELYTRLELPE